jgi:hypothetical protein
MRSAKDKAIELYFKYEKELRIYQDNGFYYDGRKTKNACLIAVDEIIEELYRNNIVNRYWDSVKQEIEKL